MSLIKSSFNFLKFLLYLVIVSLTLIELIFRMMPVSSSLKVKAVNDQNPIYHFSENRNVTIQIGSKFSHVNVKKVNNYGFLSDIDFIPKNLRKKKLIAVIGDSFVEAVQVENSSTFHSILDQEIDNYNVYPFGVSGAPLSQYLAYANFAKLQFEPDINTAFINGG